MAASGMFRRPQESFESANSVTKRAMRHTGFQGCQKENDACSGGRDISSSSPTLIQTETMNQLGACGF